MTHERRGDADAERTLALLWGAGTSAPRRGRGRRPKVSLEQVVGAAVGVADADGLPAVSMARVAGRLGVGVMTLYGYVPGKAELVDLMVDAVLRERSLRRAPETAAGWRERVEHYADETVATHRRHPWLCQVSSARPPLGPAMMAEHEYLLTALEETGLPASIALATAGAIATHVTATARQEAEDAHTERTTGQSWDAWWTARQHLWSDYFDPATYPAMTRAWRDGGTDGRDDAAPEPRWHGLRLLLDGVEAAARSR